ncbi:RNA polymerase sigma factor (sigma-70 family) [Neolewinella xylanilytica]|uniref:RNA polymerase sigma factor (Sigma-70 family) n=1 Tax=Neolewinella xylanilytica TaxID=1514080 RepID=A0A2S6IAR3_9BACT|nr:sigma-70 family RNA polymerase sigma factor [Neolewinella xylanilytica]PPK88597.1 RNA polymerase sigma factor (sigma-70 family) [Neolewinella xylanilytica]
MRYSTTVRWQEIYARYRSELEAFVHSRIDDEEARDILQDVWAALSAALENQQLDNPRAWLYRVARNRLTDRFRSQSSRPDFLDPTVVDQEEVADVPYSAPRDLREEIDRAIDTLPAKQREVFIRNAVRGETLREIAADLGVPLKTVISRKGYARQRLRDLLQELYDDYFGPE